MLTVPITKKFLLLASSSSSSTPQWLPSCKLLLSLALRHQFDRNPSLQIHSLLLTTGALHHRHRHRHRQVNEISLVFSTLLRHYSLGCFPHEAILFHKQIVSASDGSRVGGDSFTFSFLLKACANMPRPDEGVQLHGLAFKVGFQSHVYVQTALVNMYLECGWLWEAVRVFDEMPERNPVGWNVVITGLTKWGEVDLARSVLDRMPRRNVVSWTGILDGYTRAGRPGEALLVFREMFTVGVRPTEVTVLAVVPAVSNLRALDMADTICCYCRKVGLDEADVRVGNSLIDMYAKCGCIEKSLREFEEMSDRRNLVSWTSMVSGFAMHGMAEEAVGLFQRMEEANVRPNRVTFLSVLSACSHGGLVEEGMRFFSAMVDKYGIEPEIKHYGCMVDMLGRAGGLEEAERMILGMPVEANTVVWRTLLGCCNMHGNAEMGERVMKRIMEIGRGYGGDYVMLSNVLAGAGRFGDAEGVRRIMNERNVLKIPGHSFIGLCSPVAD